MKVLAFSLAVLATFAVVLTGSTTEPPEMCDFVCPKPLPEEPILLPSPERCQDYCQCDPRGAILRHCAVYNNETGERLYFNAMEKVCDWPEASGCVNPEILTLNF